MTEEEALERALKASMSESAKKKQSAKSVTRNEDPKVKPGLPHGVKVKIENQQNRNFRKLMPKPETPKSGIKPETPKADITPETTKSGTELSKAGIKTETPKPGVNKTQTSMPPNMINNQGARDVRKAPVVPAFQVSHFWFEM